VSDKTNTSLWDEGCPAVLALACFALLITASPTAKAQATDAKCANAGPFVTKIQSALAAKDAATAKRDLEVALTSNPNCADLYLLFGLADFQEGAISDSIQHYKRALELNPRSYSAHYNLALSYLREHNLPDARAQLEQAVTLDRHQADAAYNLGVVLLEMHQPDAALGHLRHARSLNPRRADVAFNVVLAELEAGHTTEARADARESATHFGSDFQWNVVVGQLFLRHSQAKAAVGYLLAANHMRPGDLDARHQLALAYLESGQNDEVVSLIPEPRSSEDHYLLASAYYAAHRFAQAEKESEQAFEMSPDNPQILALRTRLLQRVGQQDNALLLAQKAIALAPDWDEPYYLAGISLYFIRRYQEAEQDLARAVELNPNAARALFLQSIALANLGKIADAERSLRRAIELDPQNARLRCHLGILLARKNESAPAEASFRKSIELKSNYGLSHFELGKLLVSSKQFQPAAAEFEQAIKYDPRLSAAYYQLGRVYARLGESGKSQQMLAEFERLHKQEEQDSGAVDKEQNDDARKATD
jgi:tetratricopeptide (TPR) repeat protein